MEDSILKSTKKVLGLADTDTSFDEDVLTHINSAITTGISLGVISAPTTIVEDASKVWTDLGVDSDYLAMFRSYVYLKVRLAFDPPATSFHIEAINKQIAEQEWRMNVNQDFKEETA